MKHINIIKRAIYVISISLLSLVFFACDSGLSEAKKGNCNEEISTGIKVSGKISLAGAGPSKNVSRSATFSTPEFITWVITAEAAEDDGSFSRVASAFTYSNEFEIVFPTSGVWSINVAGYAGAYGDNDGDGQVDIPENLSPAFTGSLEEYYIPEDGLDDISIDVFTNKSSEEGKGIVNLAISDTSEAITQGTAVFTSRTNDEQPTTKDFSFEGGNTAIYVAEISAGCYTLNLTFEDGIGNILYKCNESVNVYEGLTTDTWYGDAPYLIDGIFTITMDLISGYGTELVPNTNYVLYSQTNSGYQYYLRDSPSADVNGAADFSSSGYSFCFDANGNFYYLDREESIYTIYKNGAEHATFENYSDYSQYITVDLATNIMYTWNLNESQLVITKYPDLILTGDTSDSITYRINSPVIIIDGENVDVCPDLCTINNGIAYVIERDPSSYERGSYLCKAPLQGEGYSLTESDCLNLGFDERGLHGASITDLIYQDGSIYMLVKQSDLFSDPITSRGAVIQYNILLNSLTTIGLSEITAGGADYGSQKLNSYFYDNQTREFYQLFSDAGQTTPLCYLTDLTYIDNNDTPEEDDDIVCTFYSLLPDIQIPAAFAENLSTEYFYGPSKFIAIKPKKLVIADEGIAFYTDNDVLKYKNVNRVVTVDLESFAISTAENTAAKFGEEETNDLIFESVVPGTTDFNKLFYSDVLNGTKYYTNSAGEDKSYSESYYLRFGVPCGDNE